MINPDSSMLSVDHEIQSFLSALKQDNFSEAKSLFAKNQVAGLFPKGEKLLPWLITTLGKKMTLKFIYYFVQSPCIYCKNGLEKCENCNGKGHHGHEIICNSCLSFGIKLCDFCAGTGWCTIDFVPPGLRFAVFTERIRVARGKIKTIILNPLPETLNAENIHDTQTKYIQQLFDLNRQIVVLENMVDATRQLVEEASPEQYNEKISQFVQKCMKTILLSKRRIVKIVEQIITLAKMDAENINRDSEHRLLFSERIKFLSGLLTSTPRFANTFLEHPFLNKEAQKLGFKLD